MKRTPTSKPRPLLRTAAACLLIGLALSVLSVPLAALVSQRWGAFSSGSSMVGEMHRIPDGQAEDGVYFLTEHQRPAATTGGTTTGGGRGVLMRLRGSTRAAPSYASQFLDGPNELEPHEIDPRPTFLRAPPPEGYATVEALSAGWPRHAAYGLRYRSRGTPPIENGLIALPFGQQGDRLPWRPIWGGLAGNTLVYAALVLAGWAAFGLVRSARRRKRGACAACGYPLDEGMQRCPECGELAGSAVPTAPLR